MSNPIPALFASVRALMMPRVFRVDNGLQIRNYKSTETNRSRIALMTASDLELTCNFL